MLIKQMEEAKLLGDFTENNLSWDRSIQSAATTIGNVLCKISVTNKTNDRTVNSSFGFVSPGLLLSCLVQYFIRQQKKIGTGPEYSATWLFLAG